MSKRAIRFFNTTGPCNPEEHYMLPPEERLIGAQLDRYVKDKLYWVLYAPRQTGKTTFLQSWMRKINAGEEAVACYVSVERCQIFEEVERAMPAISSAIQEYAGWLNLPVPELRTTDCGSMLSNILGDWAEKVLPKPLVVLFDEVDVLQGAALISFLRQLRGGFASRGIGKFPVSVALMGMRDLKDYITAAKGGAAPNPGSPFNIKADSAVIGNFSREDVGHLFLQRTEETGQEITKEALDYVYEQSGGQPWIVNSLFMRATLRVLDGKSAEIVKIEHVKKACEQMIKARETHLDALGKRLADPRIRKVIQTIITGDLTPLGRNNPEVEMAMDLGLVEWSSERGFKISNPVCEEILTRELNSGYHDSLPPPSFLWRKEDGSLDMESLLKEFQGFWQENSAAWEKTTNYTEAFPHLLLMAFLQRLTNGEGRIEREYAAGRGRMDLGVEYKGKWEVIEVKLRRDGQSYEKIKESGIKQVKSYKESLSAKRRGAEAGCYLIIFDRRAEAEKLPWSEKLKWSKEEDVTVIGC